MLKTGLLLGATVVLAACASKPAERAQEPPAPSVQPAPSDSLRCLEAAECTLKVARALLFVLDYAEIGGALVERQGRRLVTPESAQSKIWPRLEITLPEAQKSSFEFHSQCAQSSCLWTKAQLDQAFARYLEGQRCLLSTAACRD